MYNISVKKNVGVFTDSYENIHINFKRDQFVDLIQIKEPKKLNWPIDFIHSIQNPINSLPLNRLAIGVKKVAIVISDATRGVPSDRLLPLIIKELKNEGIKLEQIIVVIALGVHRKASIDEMKSLIGEEFFGKITIINHDAYDNNKLIYLGKTKYGTEVEVNRFVYDADLRIIIGKVEPHEFAGFSGGRKSILPGISSEKTIRMNHSPEMILREGSSPGNLYNNLIHLDMLEAVKLLKIHYSVNVVLNSHGDTIGLFSGDLLSSHTEAVNFLKSFCEIRIEKLPDIIITTPGYPLNIDFYQSVKPLIALEPISNKGTIIILYSSCPDGFNSTDMLWPFENARNLEEVQKKLLNNYRIQMDHALLLIKILNKGIKIITYSPNIKAELLKKIFIEPAAGLQQALDKAISYFSKNDIRILIFPQAQRTLPFLVKKS